MKHFYSQITYKSQSRQLAAAGTLRLSAEKRLEWLNEKILIASEDPRAWASWISYEQNTKTKEGFFDAIRSAACRLLGETQMIQGQGTDFFLETPRLAQRLIESVREIDLRDFELFRDFTNTSFVIHPLSPDPAVLVTIVQAGSTTYTHCSDDAGKVGSLFWGDFTQPNKKVTTEIDHYAARLAAGFALYISAFKHAIVDGLPAIATGLPEDAKHPNHYRKAKCVTIRADKALMESRGPQGPQTRRWHWKKLTSERYTEMRGMKLLIATYHTKGTSKLVLDIDDTQDPT